jgi:hypothetical protein
LLWREGNNGLFLEVDSMHVVKILKSEELDRSAYRSLVEDVKAMLQNL